MKPFRNWLQELWFENTEERMEWHQQPQTLKEYFQQYKWWLRREYRYQKSKEND